MDQQHRGRRPRRDDGLRASHAVAPSKCEASAECAQCPVNAKRVERTGCEPCAKCRRAARVGDQPRAWGAERVECARRPWAPLITLHQMPIPRDPDRRGDPTPWYHFMAETVPPRPERSQPKKGLAFVWTKLVLFGIERPDHQKCLDFSMLRFFLEPKRYFLVLK